MVGHPCPRYLMCKSPGRKTEAFIDNRALERPGASYGVPPFSFTIFAS
jgi:hypothetical protein